MRAASLTCSCVGQLENGCRERVAAIDYDISFYAVKAFLPDNQLMSVLVNKS